MIIAFSEGKVELHDSIKMRAKVEDEAGVMGFKVILTTVGRVILMKLFRFKHLLSMN